MRVRIIVAALWTMLLVPAVLSAQQNGAAQQNGSPQSEGRQRRNTAFLDAEQGGPDFKVQGEYVGKIGTNLDVGAHVVALGGGRFNAVLYLGGLPGAGWNRTRVRL